MQRTLWSIGFALAAAAISGRADAQGAPAAGKPAAGPTAKGSPSADAALADSTSTTQLPVPEELLQTHPGGLTAEQVGRRSAETSFSAKQAIETMRSAQERVSQQWSTWLPRLTGTAKYTRLSSFFVPDLLFPNGISNGQQQFIAVPGSQLAPQYLDQYLLQASLTVPISDYFLKLNQNVEAAKKTAEASRYDLGAARATAYTNGKVAYYTWMQARGQVIVAIQTLNDQRAHLTDTRNQFSVGNANKADVLRAETAVANAELQVETAKNAADLAETQMRIGLHVPPGTAMVPGEGLDVIPPTFQGNVAALVQEGLSDRLEVKSIVANAQSARRTAAANGGSQWPSISAFGDALEANPNSRLFPAQQKWFPTWDLGVQAIWSPNDTISNDHGKKDYEARANALEAQAEVTREGIEVEVTQAYEQVKQWDIGIEQTRRELASAEEASRVARELFNNGRGTAVTLADAETDLARSRLDALNAMVNAYVARARLDHAIGRDLGPAGASQSP